ncbi:hypothetical protein ACG0Z6_03255 [Roseateles sp. BYS180W]|uniref:Lipoprotein n=1 Tax=Roseateles rivi TaxID=3299028 RepID=A0ABW7FSE9_9BURK
MKSSATKAFLALATVALTACGGGEGGDSNGNNVVVNESVTLSEGMFRSYTLSAGNYQAEVTSSTNGVIVEWVGGNNCAKSAEVKAYSQSCQLTINGQLLVTNPTVLGLGGSEIVTVKVTKR